MECRRSGILDHVHIDPSLHVIAYRPFPGQGEGLPVKDIHTASRPIAKVILDFDSREQRDRALQNIGHLVYPVLKNEHGDWTDACSDEDKRKQF